MLPAQSGIRHGSEGGHSVWSRGRLLVCVLNEESTGTQLKVRGVTVDVGERVLLCAVQGS